MASKTANTPTIEAGIVSYNAVLCTGFYKYNDFLQYRIYLKANGSVSALSMEGFPESGFAPKPISRPDEQDPWASTFQQVG